MTLHSRIHSRPWGANNSCYQHPLGGIPRSLTINAKFTVHDDQFEFDDSDNINADYIAKKVEVAPRGTIVVVDYLQLLDQKRENPELSDQVQALRSLAKTKGLIIILSSQIDRSYDASAKLFPALEDVRLPNPVDMKHFSKTCFLNNGEIQISAMN